MKKHDVFIAVPVLLLALCLILGACKDSETVLPNQTPAASDFEIGNLAQIMGNGVTAVTVTPLAGKSPGAVTVYYNGDTEIPQALGRYAVTFDVAEAKGWDAADGLSAGILIVSLVEMVWVPGGSFQMGDTTGGGYSDEQPAHQVTLTAGFYMGKYEITQAQWLEVIGLLPNSLVTGPNNFGRGDNFPVYSVSWYDALVFCNWLSMLEGLTPVYRIGNSTNPLDWLEWGPIPATATSGGLAVWNAVEVVSGAAGYRLPTEAQWEYAAKGGNGSPGNYAYSGSNTPNDVAWYEGNNGGSGSSNYRSKEVGTKEPNGLGLYDMSGNVSEWCWDLRGYAANYPTEPQTDPMGEDLVYYAARRHRGGSWSNFALDIRSSKRNSNDPYTRNDAVGFRIARF